MYAVRFMQAEITLRVVWTKGKVNA